MLDTHFTVAVPVDRGRWIRHDLGQDFELLGALWADQLFLAAPS